MRQLPEGDEIFLDHVGWFVPDMAAASVALTRLGFLLTPFSLHGDRDPATAVLRPVGTANQLIMLETGYLELLTPVGDIDTPVARHMRAALGGGAGVHLIALSIAEPARAAAGIARAGFTLQPTIHLRRSIEAEDGSAAEVAFTVVRPDFAQFPEARVQVLAHHTPQHMWQRRYMAHPNGIVGLASVTLAVPDAGETAGRLARLAARPAAGVGRHVLALDRGRIVVEADAAATASPRAITSIGLTCRDLGLTARVLAAAGVAVARRSGGLEVGPSEALGVTLQIGPIS